MAARSPIGCAELMGNEAGLMGSGEVLLSSTQGQALVCWPEALAATLFA